MDTELYPGAAALLAGVPVPQVEELMPPFAQVRRDLPDAYRSGCHVAPDEIALNPCTFGSSDADFLVLLVGDSHAASWIPALESLALTRNWRVETHTKSGCPLLVELKRQGDGPYIACYEWGQLLLAHIATIKPDLVIFTQSSDAGLADTSVTMESVIVRTWQEILEAGVQVVAIADTPRLRVRNPSECLELDRACALPRDKVIVDDAIRRAQALEPRVALIDMTDGFCDATSCPIAIGNVIAWRDGHHFTRTYARTLAPFLGDRLMAAVGGG